MNTLRQSGLLAALALSLSWLNPAGAQAETVDEVLSFKTAPPGVVFEIVSGDPARLKKVLPQVRKDILRLRARFKDLSIAVVSHGDEQFALTRKNQERYKETQASVRSLVMDEKVDFHVCGTYASMRNVDEKEFPDYVDVAPHGPVQIKTYIEFGYVKILVE